MRPPPQARAWRSVPAAATHLSPCKGFPHPRTRVLNHSRGCLLILPQNLAEPNLAIQLPPAGAKPPADQQAGVM
jgi:hypothetical protein